MIQQSPLILALETATDACTVALGVGERIYTREAHGPRIHTQTLIPMIHEVLNEASIELADLTAIAVGRGPGSFTGVRIGVGLAQGLAFGLNKAVYPISTLAALALQAVFQSDSNTHERNCLHESLIVPILDARMKEIYVGAYRWKRQAGSVPVLDCVMSDRLCCPSELDALLAAFDAPIVRIDNQYPRAVEVLQCALPLYYNGFAGISALDVVPTYVRDNVALMPSKRIVENALI